MAEKFFTCDSCGLRTPRAVFTKTGTLCEPCFDGPTEEDETDKARREYAEASMPIGWPRKISSPQARHFG